MVGLLKIVCKATAWLATCVLTSTFFVVTFFNLHGQGVLTCMNFDLPTVGSFLNLVTSDEKYYYSLILLVYYSSINSLNRSIFSWFRAWVVSLCIASLGLKNFHVPILLL